LVAGSRLLLSTQKWVAIGPDKMTRVMAMHDSGHFNRGSISQSILRILPDGSVW